MRGRAAAFQNARRAAEERAGADGEDRFAGCGMVADEAEHSRVLHQRLLPSAAGNLQQIERRCFGERHLWGQDQPCVIAERPLPRADDMDLRCGQPGENLERPSEVDLVQVRKDQDADADGLAAQRGEGGAAIGGSS